MIWLEWYNASRNQMFKLHSTLLWTISDFLALPTCLGGALKVNKHVLFANKTLDLIGWYMVENFVTWVTVDFYRQIIGFENIVSFDKTRE